MAGKSRNAIIALWSIAVLLAICGCGDPYQLVPVTGTLSFEGKPLEGATVIFSPINAPEKTGRPANEPGRPSRGTTKSDGSFTLEQDDGSKGAVVGPHKVMFERPRTKRPGIPAGERESMTPEEVKNVQGIIAAMPIYPPIPDGLKISPDEVEVKSADNKFELQLTR